MLPKRNQEIDPCALVLLATLRVDVFLWYLSHLSGIVNAEYDAKGSDKMPCLVNHARG
jgi:hypothetical protein